MLVKIMDQISSCNNLCEKRNVELGFPLMCSLTYKIFIYNFRRLQCTCHSEPCRHLKDGTQFLGMFLRHFHSQCTFF